MKRLERLGSVAFMTVLMSFVCHIIAMSFNSWKINSCNNCGDDDNSLGTWSSALLSRCYSLSLGTVFTYVNHSNSDSFYTVICSTAKFIKVKDMQQASYCLNLSLNDDDSYCSFGNFNQDYCKCDYSSKAKLMLAMTCLAAVSLGVQIFLSHLASFIKVDYVLRWLIPVCYIDLIFALLCMLITIIAAATNRDDETNELLYSWSLFDVAYYNETEAMVNALRKQRKSQVTYTYTVTLGWCFGMEVLAFYFSVVSLILYLLIYISKRRPGAIKIIK